MNSRHQRVHLPWLHFATACLLAFAIGVSPLGADIAWAPSPISVFPAPAGSPWTLVIKGVDESVTSTTVVQNDDELTFALIANTTYFFRAYIFFNTPIAADFKFSFVCTGTQTATESKVFSTMAGSVGSTSHGVNCSAGGDFIVTGTTLPMGYVTIEMVIKQSGTAGTWTFQWAQNTSNAGATKVRAGSYVEYTITP